MSHPWTLASISSSPAPGCSRRIRCRYRWMPRSDISTASLNRCASGESSESSTTKFYRRQYGQSRIAHARSLLSRTRYPPAMPRSRMLSAIRPCTAAPPYSQERGSTSLGRKQRPATRVSPGHGPLPSWWQVQGSNLHRLNRRFYRWWPLGNWTLASTCSDTRTRT